MLIEKYFYKYIKSELYKQVNIDDKGCNGAPDLIVEILSNSKRDLDTKFHLYEANEVTEYWIVSPEDETVSVFDLVNDKYFLRRIYSNEDDIEVKVLPGCNIILREIFED